MERVEDIFSIHLLANAPGGPLELPLWTVAPFVFLLAAIALLPLLFPHFWHSNRNKGVVAFVLAMPVAGYLLALGPGTAHASTHALLHELQQYVSFIILLTALYSVAGGILVRGDIQGTPVTNTSLLAFGCVLANLIGTTGASMLLIRPFLRINRQRTRLRHLPIFFIFLVSNLGGLLTPLGDPPLFLGFLNGVPFAWTLSLWAPWLLANGLVLLIFFLWDTVAYRREPAKALERDRVEREPVRVEGLVNVLFLMGIVGSVLLQVHLAFPWCEGIQLLLIGGTLWATPHRIRVENEFSWGAIIEVAVLFIGIFVTMVPALQLLRLHGPNWGLTQPAEYFWLAGALSSFLDNAPTYLAFATLAAAPHDFTWLVANQPLLLKAVSCGAVFMGANTYIGNGPNFMVKAIADHAGYPTPSFLGYLLYSSLILLPTFGVVTLVFFR